MDFLNKLGKKASETYQVTKEKASNLSEELKIKGKINELKENISKAYREIGQIVYNEVKDGKDVSKDEVSEKCENISRMKDEIEKLETQILNIKKVKKCIQCGAALNIEDEFCSKCGKSQPKIEKVEVEVKEEPKDAKETEVIEVSNVENTNNDSNENNEEANGDNN